MSPDEREIRACIGRWHRATADGDVDTILRLMAQDAVFLTAGSAPMQCSAAFARASRGVRVHCSIRSTANVVEVVVRDDLAYAWTELSVVVTPRGGATPAPRSGPALSVLRRVHTEGGSCRATRT